MLLCEMLIKMGSVMSLPVWLAFCDASLTRELFFGTLTEVVVASDPIFVDSKNDEEC